MYISPKKKKKVLNKELDVRYITKEKQIANILTKDAYTNHLGNLRKQAQSSTLSLRRGGGVKGVYLVTLVSLDNLLSCYITTKLRCYSISLLNHFRLLFLLELDSTRNKG